MNERANKPSNKLGKILAFAASGYGLIQYSDDQKKYIASFNRCPNCRRRIRKKKIKQYSVDGKELSYWRIIPLLPAFFECPECHYRWKVFRDSKNPKEDSVQVAGVRDVVVTESERSEESLGEDQKIIDNSATSITMTRRFSVSKEWSQTCEINYAAIKNKAKRLGIGIQDWVSFQRLSQSKIAESYSLRQGERQVHAEEITFNVPAHTKMRVVFQWKRIWQSGLLIFTYDDGNKLEVPFRIAIAVTFDQIVSDMGFFAHLPEKCNKVN